MTYWWCLEHSRVEQTDKCRGAVRLGPYSTEAEAARAVQSVADRNARLDAEDRAYDEG